MRFETPLYFSIKISSTSSFIGTPLPAVLLLIPFAFASSALLSSFTSMLRFALFALISLLNCSSSFFFMSIMYSMSRLLKVLIGFTVIEDFYVLAISGSFSFSSGSSYRRSSTRSSVFEFPFMIFLERPVFLIVFCWACCASKLKWAIDLRSCISTCESIGTGTNFLSSTRPAKTGGFFYWEPIRFARFLNGESGWSGSSSSKPFLLYASNFGSMGVLPWSLERATRLSGSLKPPPLSIRLRSKIFCCMRWVACT